MRHISIILLLLLITFPVLAQNDDYTSYEFDTGTTLDYPAEWDAELDQGILALTLNSETQALIIDYPIIYTLSEAEANISGRAAVEILANIFLETEIDRRDIYEFKIGVRNIVAYDTRNRGSFFAVEFSNMATGMLVTIGINDDLENDLLVSFDNSEEINPGLFLPAVDGNVTRTTPVVYVFESDQRVMIPVGWNIALSENDTSPVLILTVPDSDTRLQLLDLSTSVARNTDLEAVLDTVDIDLEETLDMEITSGAIDTVFSDREAISYDVLVDGVEGQLIVLRYADNDIGLVLVSGSDNAPYQLEISQIIGSFNNFAVALALIQ